MPYRPLPTRERERRITALERLAPVAGAAAGAAVTVTAAAALAADAAAALSTGVASSPLYYAAYKYD